MNLLKKIFRTKNEEVNYAEMFGEGLVEIRLTPTTRCSARCTTCLNHTIKNHYDLDKDLFYSLVEQVLEIKKNITNPMYFSFFNLGESYLYEGFADCCEWAIPKLKEAGIRTSIVTNGSHIDRIPQGIDDFFISFNAGEKETYEEITGLDFEKVKNNILRLYREGEMKKASNVQIHMLCFDGNKGQETAFKEVFKELEGIGCRFSYKYDNQHGETEHAGIEEKVGRVPCDYLTNKINVYPNGDVHMCAHDFLDTVSFGNLKKDKLTTILQSETRRKMIENHRKGVYTGLCEKCDYNCDVEDMDIWFKYDKLGK